MASIEQLNSFIGKFVSLWKTGQNAILKIEAVAGKAKIALEHGLGEAPPVECLLPGKCIDVEHPAPVPVGLSRQRRRERRASARKVVAEEATAAEAEEVEPNVVNKFPTQTTEEVVADVKAEEVEDVRAEESVSDVPAKTAESVVDVRAEDAPSREGIEEVKVEEVNG